MVKGLGSYTLPSYYKRELYKKVKHNDKKSHLSFVYKFLLIRFVNCPFLLLFWKANNTDIESSTATSKTSTEQLGKSMEDGDVGRTPIYNRLSAKPVGLNGRLSSSINFLIF